MAYQDVKIQRTVNSPLKVKRTIYREPENPVRFAYEKLLRERDRTKRVFTGINPYAEVYTFRENLYGILTLSLDGMGNPWIFVIDGPERALVIDTSFGLGDLKSLIEELIGKDKEYFVANTHSHFDHAYGNFQFDKVYCHEYEVPLLTSKRNPHIWDYLFDENGNGIWADFDRNDLVPFREYEIVGVPDGYLFDLGQGHEIELVWLPGHSPGHCGFLDKKNRIFFPGDDCCVGNVGAGGGGTPGQEYREYLTIEALTKELRKVIARMDEFDSMFPSHGPVETGPVMLLSLLETCEEVLADPSDYDYRKDVERNGRKFTQYGKRIFESGYLTYTENGVYMDHAAEIR
ncbi:MAG: MBL fold metallo-hydrolase [Lachnospiraceae bacterium]|nr:MBL fold metallo-hydrolase [Lachnospiraceae bacterium]